MSRTALIVDDSTSMRQMVAFALEESGFEVVEGADGQQALDELDRLEAEGTPLDVIVTDLNMPVLDGLEFIREVRRRAPWRFVPILMLTTESQSVKKAEGREAGATGWIVKPFDPDTLLAAIDRVLGRSRVG